MPDQASDHCGLLFWRRGNGLLGKLLCEDQVEPSGRVFNCPSPATPFFTPLHDNLLVFLLYFLHLIAMKSLRKSLNGHHKESHLSITSPLPALSKPRSAIQPPKKVIRALAPYKASAPQELSFEKGDFFHVINDAGHGQWYEAHNPMSGARGLVPCSCFEEFAKGGTMYGSSIAF